MSTKVGSVRITKRNNSFRAKRRTVCDNSLMSMASGHFLHPAQCPESPAEGGRVFVRNAMHGAR